MLDVYTLPGELKVKSPPPLATLAEAAGLLGPEAIHVCAFANRAVKKATENKTIAALFRTDTGLGVIIV